MRRFLNRIKDWATRDIIREIKSASELQRALPLLQSLPDATQHFEYAGVPVAFYLPEAVYDGLQRHILLTRQFFAEHELRLIRGRYDLEGATIIDVGANIGNHTVFFSAVCRAAEVHSFEPNPRAFRILERNVAINRLQGVQLHRAGLSDRPYAMSIAFEDSGNLGGTQFREGGKDERKVEAVPLDSLQIGNATFLKIDVEGMSSAVLEGAKETIALGRPVIEIELWPEERSRGDQLLRRLGYRVAHDLGAYTYLYEPTTTAQL
jgi:FkbM family methyltransferase